METKDVKDVITELRQSLGISQQEFADQLFVTRQAVSRWENGDTIPQVETLKLMAETFHVSVDRLLGYRFCQSCGIPLTQDGDLGTQADGSPSQEYCVYCLQQGKFHTQTMEEQINTNLMYLDAWNESAGLHLTPEEAREQLQAYLPNLKRWAVPSPNKDH